jgi:CMP-N-acetylneuraminic acid synthetase
MRLLAVIPARGGSKGIPRKNLREVGGRPLIVWTIAAARSASCLDRIVVSTDDRDIANISREAGAEVLLRPTELAGDDTPTRPVLKHAHDLLSAEGFVAAAVVTLQPTSPLRRPHHIVEAVAQFSADPSADSLVSVIDVPHVFHPQSVMRRDEAGYLAPYLPAEPTPTRRQDKPAVFARNGAAVYITRASRLDEYVFGGRLLGYRMSPEDSLDIDTLDDLAEADRVLRQRA